MGEYVLKVGPETDLYALYSTVSGTIVFTGTREETRILMSTPTRHRGVPPLSIVADQLDLADATGTSLMMGDPPDGAFAANHIDIAHHELGLRSLRRDRFPAYINALRAGDDDATAALLESRFPGGGN
jgi:hypothetical protein